MIDGVLLAERATVWFGEANDHEGATYDDIEHIHALGIRSDGH